MFCNTLLCAHWAFSPQTVMTEFRFKIRSAREKKEMTQEELANRINKKRTFISKVENDGENITLKTLFDIVERGLGGRLKIEVQI